MPSLLVTNDFPPKTGGIQSYLYELWRRLPATDTTVFTTAFDGARAWDAGQAFRVVRADQRTFWPTPGLARDIDALAREVRADVVFVDPMLPLGLVGPRLRAAPYTVVAHGAEITVYGRVPGTRLLGRRVLCGAAAIVAAGGYPAREAVRCRGTSSRGCRDSARRRRRAVPSGRSCAAGRDPASVRTRPRAAARARVVAARAAQGIRRRHRRDARAPHVQLAIAGGGRDRARLERLAGTNTTFVGRVPGADLPALYACADVFAMCCRERWAGLEAEGFGIVFLEAAACGVPAVAGRSGGAHEAVVDGETGFVVSPRATGDVRAALELLTEDEKLRAQMGAAARRRACDNFAYDDLVARLAPIARGDFSGCGTLDG